jgi:hypothetical protein
MMHKNKIESDQLVDDNGCTPAAPDGASRPNCLQQLSLPLSLSIACAVCGNPFEISRRRGRPERFCSDACRGMQHRQQKAEWGKLNSVTSRRLAKLT